MTKLPSEPLIRQVERRGGIGSFYMPKEAEAALRRAYYRARDNGWLTIGAADTLSIALLGLHPALVWGSEFFD